VRDPREGSENPPLAPVKRKYALHLQRMEGRRGDIIFDQLLRCHRDSMNGERWDKFKTVGKPFVSDQASNLDLGYHASGPLGSPEKTPRSWAISKKPRPGRCGAILLTAKATRMGRPDATEYPSLDTDQLGSSSDLVVPVGAGVGGPSKSKGSGRMTHKVPKRFA
jgi:hypothetical protein